MTAGGQAELGRALGGYVNVVTRSGTNLAASHGLRLLPGRPVRAANALSGTKLPMDQQQFGGSLGGPSSVIARSSSPTPSSISFDQSGVDDNQRADVAVINARLEAVGYPGARVITGPYDEPGGT